MHLKKFLTVIAAIAASTSAKEIVNTDFTQYSGNSGNVTVPGWVDGQWNGNNTPRYNFGSNGAVVAQSWKQNTLMYSLTSTPIVNSESYDITFTTYATTKNQQNAFFLSSSSYTILIGNSYDTNTTVAVGTANSCAATDGKLYTFQTGNNRVVVPALTAVESSGDITRVDVSKSLTYNIFLTGGLLKMTVTDGTNSYAAKYTIKNSFSFDTIGFINDGATGTAGVKSVKIVPEPTTATLSLLALAGLAARRRRK